MWFALVPIGDGSNIILQRLVFPIGPPAKGLDGHTKVLVEKDRVHNVPAVKAPLGRAVVADVFEYVASVRSAVDLREAIASAQVVFGPGAANGRKCSVTIDEELDLPLAEPPVRQLCPRKKCSGILPSALACERGRPAD